ncbi:hypothetical protein DL95DRAFT_408585 [Leptodontidium sp. 2 PMI_412]|nr:hypothetical protein DL95DRAFT_408585 [Leptodontidium sp. 2 PMI_412]
MVRTFLSLPLLLLLTTLSTFHSTKIFTAALPTPNLSLTQQTIHPLSSSPPSLPSPNQNQNQKLCGIPLFFLYPCTWTSDPSISRLEKLPPVIVVKYIFNIPGTLLGSIFAPLAALEDRSRSQDQKLHFDSRSLTSEANENGNERGDENESSNKRDLQLPLQPGSKHQLLDLEKEKEIQEQAIWSWCGMAPFFIFPCKANIPDQEVLCTSTGKRDGLHTQCVKRTIDDLKSSVPGLSSLPKLWIETVKQIPRGVGMAFPSSSASSSSSSRTSTHTNPKNFGEKDKTYIRPSLRIRDIKTQSSQPESSASPQLEKLNGTTTVQESTTLKSWE